MTPADWSRVYSAYEEACDLAPEERTAFIESALPEEGHRSRAFELLARLSAEDPPEPATQ